MDYEHIMQEIKSSLSGDVQTDLIYLQEQLSKYREHHLSEELAWGIGRLIFEVLPEDQKQLLGESLAQDNRVLGTVLEEAQNEIAEQHYERGVTLLESLVEKIDAIAPKFETDREHLYLCFDNLLEEILYRQLYKPDKEILPVPQEYADIFLVYGNLLLEMERVKEARQALLKSTRWNPMKVETLFELGEVYKQNQQMKRYLEINIRALSQAYTPQNLARCYRNLGYYYVEKENYELAVALYCFSVKFDKKNQIPEAALQYIQHKWGRRVVLPSFQQCKDLFAQQGIQMGPHDLVLSIAISLGDKARESQAYDEAAYYYTLVYELTGDPEVKSWIDALARQCQETVRDH
jgi:tetratricopeptide (TPR) repeat protein